MRSNWQRALRAAIVSATALVGAFGLWYAGGGYAYWMAGIDKANLQQAHRDLRLIRNSLEQYRMQTGSDSYPATLHGLKAFAAAMPLVDPWGNNYQYQTNGSMYTVYTAYVKHRFGTIETVRVVSGDSAITTVER